MPAPLPSLMHGCDGGGIAVMRSSKWSCAERVPSSLMTPKLSIGPSPTHSCLPPLVLNWKTPLGSICNFLHDAMSLSLRSNVTTSYLRMMTSSAGPGTLPPFHVPAFDHAPPPVPL